MTTPLRSPPPAAYIFVPYRADDSQHGCDNCTLNIRMGCGHTKFCGGGFLLDNTPEGKAKMALYLMGMDISETP